MTITERMVVSIHYKVADAATDEMIDSSEGDEPMTYLHGAQNIIPGLERALEGKSVGDQVSVTIDPPDAYGDYSEDRVQEVPIEAFEQVEDLKPGMIVTAQSGDGQINLVVTEVAESTVTVDANHPLAGKALAFDVSVISIREASDEEIAHGHVHGPGGHHH